jgi:hypothetical protein
MAMTLSEFVKASGAQIVAGRLIVGERQERRFVGSTENGTFNLNEEGQALQEELEAKAREAAKPKAPKAKPVPVVAEAATLEDDRLQFDIE